MTYNSNHWTCFKSNWNEKNFDPKATVYFEKMLSNDILDKYNLKLEDLDYRNLIVENKILEKKEYDSFVNKKIKYFKDNNQEIDYQFLEKNKKFFEISSFSLKPEVIEWLNNNIKDKKGTNENTPLEERKGWCIPSDTDEFYQRTFQFWIWFHRQIDALRFIKEFSIYKEPVFYFDYFNYKRKVIDLEKIKNIQDIDLTNIKQESNTIFNYYDCLLLDWEKEVSEEEFCDDVHLNTEEVKNLIDINIK